LDNEIKTIKSGFSKKFNKNLHINKSKKDYSLEENIFYSTKKTKDNRTKSHMLKLRSPFFLFSSNKKMDVSQGNNTNLKINSNFFNEDNNNENDDQSYAFQNLINLNKDKTMNININLFGTINIYDYKNKIIKNRKLEKSEEKGKFYLKESKQYFNEDKHTKGNNDNRKYSDIAKSKFKLDNINNKKIEHNSIKFGAKGKNIEILEYDGDMETITFRYDDNNEQNERKKTIENNISDKEQNKEPISKKRMKSAKKNSKSINKNNNSHEQKCNYKNNRKEIIEIIEPKNINFDKTEINKINNYNMFCDGFFVAGIPKPFKAEKILKDSSDFHSTCGHQLCSSLYSIDSEILFIYNKERLNLSEEKINTLAKLTFPLGVKVCLDNNNLDSKAMINSPQQIFVNIIENDNGEKLYLCTCYHYEKSTLDEFKEKFGFNISIFYSELFKKINAKNKNNFNTFFIPESITLISRYPLFEAMSICLNSFFSPIILDRNNILNHIINEVPIPSFNSQIKFYLLFYTIPIIINHEMNLYKLMSMSNKEKQMDILNNTYLLSEGIDFITLFKSISLEHIIFIINMILLEQKILLVYKDYQKLSNIIIILVSLLFPFSLKNNIFPIIHLDMIDKINNEKYFIAGIDESLFNNINKHKIILENDIIIYNISLNNFISSKNMKKTSRKDILHEYKLCPLPEKIFNFLLKELKIILKDLNSNSGLYKQQSKEESLENYMKLIMFKQNIVYLTKLNIGKGMIMLIGDLDDYILFHEEKILFNKEAFIESHKDKDFKNFVKMFINTNQFNDFLEEQKILYFSKDTNSNDEINNENKKYTTNIIYSNAYYFNKISENFKNLRNNFRIKNNSFNLSKIITKEIKIKAKKISKNLKLIDDSLMRHNGNKNKSDLNLNNNSQQESMNTKNKSNILFSRKKKYLEDKINNNNKTNIYENNSKSYYNIKSHYLKDSKISTDISPLSEQFKLTNEFKHRGNTPNTKNNLFCDDVNSLKNIQLNDGNAKNHTKGIIIKKYLLSPYFLTNKFDDELYIKEHKDEKSLLKEIETFKNKKEIGKNFPPLTNIIYRNLKQIYFNKYIFKKDKIYMINNDNNFNNKISNKDDIKIKLKKELESFNKKYYKMENNENEITNLKELFENDDNIILINKLFKYCFEQKMELKDTYLPIIKKLFSNIENLEYFASIIVPDNLLRSKKNQKQLTIISFSSFSKIIKIAFENMNLNDKNIGFFLTLSCFIYYKLEKDKIIYLYSEFLFKKLEKSKKPYLLWNNESFWIEFFNCLYEFNNTSLELGFEDKYDSESTNSDNENNNNIYLIDSNQNKKECLIISVITLSNIMLKLGINKNFVMDIIEKMILPVFINDFDFINEIMKFALITNTIN